MGATDWTRHAACRSCARTTRLRAGSFYRGLQLLPEPQRTAMYVIYAWMRSADDCVDGAADAKEGALALDGLEQCTRALFERGDAGGDALLEALGFVHAHFNLPVAPFEEMIQGQRRDLDPSPMATSADLERYCGQVASSVGVLCLHVWGCADPRALELARTRGIAFQLTNILRDVGEDLQRGRCYLPMEDGPDAVDQDALAAWHSPEPCSALVLHWCARARRYYEASAALDAMVAGRCRSTLVAMTGVYTGILAQIESRPKRCVLGPRASLSGVRKCAIALRALLLKR